MIEGTLIAESIRVGAELAAVPLVARRIWRAAAGDLTAGQPELWTLIEFEAEEPDAEVLAASLAAVLVEEGGWYTDFRTPAEAEGRAEAAAYGRSKGVPEEQLDWPV
jgi:hypothetical protein